MRRLTALLAAAFFMLAACTPAQVAGFIWTNRDPGGGVPCSQWAGAFRIAGFHDGYELQHMLALVRRESNCTTGVVSSTNDWGLAQINLPSWRRQLVAVGIIRDAADLLNPQANAHAAHYVYEHQGWDAWATNF
jgi:soluble lytic murein transglycosylase-like protein